MISDGARNDRISEANGDLPIGPSGGTGFEQRRLFERTTIVDVEEEVF